MTNIIPTRWPDLANVSIHHASLLSGSRRCTLRYRGREAVSVLLLSGGVFSIIGQDANGAAPDEVAEALARVVAVHTQTHSDEIIPLKIDIQRHRHRDCDTYGWHDLPGVRVSVQPIAGNRIRCAISTETGMAGIIIASDPVISVAWSFAPAGERPISIAIGRALLAHDEAGRIHQIRTGAQ